MLSTRLFNYAKRAKFPKYLRLKKIALTRGTRFPNFLTRPILKSYKKYENCHFQRKDKFLNHGIFVPRQMTIRL